MKVIIERFAYLPRGTYGRATIEMTDFNCFTVEKPWRNNEPFKSCVPTGEYIGVRHESTNRQKGEFALVNETLNIFNSPEDIPDHRKESGRFKCLIFDIANHPDELQGCVAAGIYNQLTWLNPGNKYTPYLSVISSGLTRSKFSETIGGESEIQVVIKKFEGAWP